MLVITINSKLTNWHRINPHQLILRALTEQTTTLRKSMTLINNNLSATNKLMIIENQNINKITETISTSKKNIKMEITNQVKDISETTKAIKEKTDSLTTIGVQITSLEKNQLNTDLKINNAETNIAEVKTQQLQYLADYKANITTLIIDANTIKDNLLVIKNEFPKIASSDETLLNLIQKNFKEVIDSNVITQTSLTDIKSLISTENALLKSETSKLNTDLTVLIKDENGKTIEHINLKIEQLKLNIERMLDLVKQQITNGQGTGTKSASGQIIITNKDGTYPTGLNANGIMFGETGSWTLTTGERIAGKCSCV